MTISTHFPIPRHGSGQPMREVKASLFPVVVTQYDGTYSALQTSRSRAEAFHASLTDMLSLEAQGSG